MNTLYIQMGYCEGGTLMRLIKNQKGERIEIQKILSYFCQLMDAINHCHVKKLVHRDIKVSLYYKLSINMDITTYLVRFSPTI